MPIPRPTSDAVKSPVDVKPAYTADETAAAVAAVPARTNKDCCCVPITFYAEICMCVSAAQNLNQYSPTNQMLDPRQSVMLTVELCIPNDETLQKQVWHEILKRNLSDSVEVWPYSVAESFAPVKVITPTASGQIADVQTAAVAAIADSATQPNWLAKEIKHAIKNKTGGNPLPPGSPPLIIKTNHQHAHTLLVSIFQWEASQPTEPKNVFYATQAVIKEAQRLGYHRIALPLLDAKHVEEILNAILSYSFFLK
jgi:hypothetical protein